MSEVYNNMLKNKCEALWFNKKKSLLINTVAVFQYSTSLMSDACFKRNNILKKTSLRQRKEDRGHRRSERKDKAQHYTFRTKRT